MNEKTQLERFVDLLTEMGVGYQINPVDFKKTAETLVMIDEGKTGYSGFYCLFGFGADGKLVTYHCGE